MGSSVKIIKFLLKILTNYVLIYAKITKIVKYFNPLLELR